MSNPSKTAFLSPARALIIAGSTFTQLMRMKVFYFLAIFAVITIGANFLDLPIHAAPESKGAEVLYVIKNTSIGCMSLFSIVIVALLTGVAVAFTGIISFVGLVVPHLVRMIIGPAHRGLILASAVGEGALLVIADLLTRVLVPGAELPIGMLTALVGGPFFFWLIRRERSRSGGWA